MAIRRLSTASIKTGSKSNKLWDQDTQQGAMVLLASSTVNGSNVSDITFTNISQDYQDLMIVFSGRRTDAASQANIFIVAYNSTIVGSPFGTSVLETDGVSNSSYRYSTQSSQYAGVIPAASAAAGTFGTVVGHVLNYTTTWGWKMTIWKNASDANAGGASTNRTGIRIGSTQQLTPVNSVNVSTFNGSIYMAPGTTCTLYGIKAGA